MSVRNSFASLDESDDDEPKQQVKKAVTSKPKAPAAAAPARNNNRRDDRPRRDDNRRDNRGGRRGEYNRDAGDSNARKYRRDDRRTDRRRDADRKDRRREGNSGDRRDDRRGRNQYEKTHQKRGPKKAGHGGWGTDKDAVAVAEEDTATSPTAETPTEDVSEETPSEPAAPAVRELTLEEHEAAEKERRAKFNERWGAKPAAVDLDLEKEFSGMSVVGKKSRKAGAVTSTKKTGKTVTKSAQKAKELKKAIFAEPNHFGSDDRARGYGGRGRGGGRGGRGRNRGGPGRDNRRRGGNVNTQDANEFPALA